ncbi:MAG: hypothetical protein A3G32_09130 [Deltaproteobacteria bacterium RIFCSPLOWO2_12_FULL_40_28]|nr:MAG: hypothetical protein A3C45_07985 [Deltaproteobacteria bacterium RIFCSPHIGHO2_02_FULL_40_28]OGQ21183.1 MAG: hypothetical protein A3E27_01620 [Deltaproteobacteria bacterium RIFCSPHIGHO2_12_FULL_40_32]OGQ39084.1 MAG: hypothetical protein A3I69_09255 [Deltaproteobacteria bacterium RIFCSPLOWO2_02_FULL_40_36]OGQ53157.1 MAG: hypothetical protein A3G32_09130 [Deltaproteobacteria bacterium RIFCSPLOWO2_12_FULL_40_28]
MEYVQFFIGVIFSPEVKVAILSDLLSGAMGVLGEVSSVYDFNHTQYYKEEMGAGLKKIFFAIKRLEDPSHLLTLKKHSIELEKNFFTKQGKRLANLDPGYLDAVKIVLASGKKGGHKIALGDGIYADMVLDYFTGHFRSFEWTFPDFKSGIYFPFFETLRANYLKHLSVIPA